MTCFRRGLFSRGLNKLNCVALDIPSSLFVLVSDNYRHFQSNMNWQTTTRIPFIFALLITLVALAHYTPAQKAAPPPIPENLLKRTTTRHENQRFGFGGTVSIVGAPVGSITIEGWSRSEVDVVADIELNAATEDDLSRLAVVNNFAFDPDVNHISVLTTGVHDRVFMRKATKNFPKNLLSMPWKIDYRIRVPANTDLEINAGRGTIKLNGVEGAIRLSAAEGDVTLVLTGGVVSATVAAGNVLVNIPARSWRGSGADIRVAAGSLTLELPRDSVAILMATYSKRERLRTTTEHLHLVRGPG